MDQSKKWITRDAILGIPYARPDRKVIFPSKPEKPAFGRSMMRRDAT
jgi:hypothetical protein